MFKDVSLLSVVLQDESAARVFVEHELDALDSATEENLQLRRTIVAYVRADKGAKAAARVLGVSERTVRYRMAKAEQVYGGTLHARMPELVIAAEAAEALELQRRQRLTRG
jgi:DNA-binding PucR family transcriptional regulator